MYFYKGVDMFGPVMRFNTESGLVIELRPMCSEDMPEFIKNNGLQSYQVIIYLGRINAPVIEDEKDWFDVARKNKSDMLWGIYVCHPDGSREIIGSTGLHGIDELYEKRYLSATTGIVIFNRDYWGKGIASVCHKARTMYAFDMLGLVILRSGVIVQNEASRRAVESVGYAVQGRGLVQGCIKGNPREDYELHCINPCPYDWNYFWHGRKPSKSFRDARMHAQAAIDWGRENVELP
jgi:RimJ/RimL family protein N-acetyltransferase